MKIFCVGRNYKAHAAEMGSDVPTKPVIFMKPPTALTSDEKPYYIPTWTNDLQHEVEIVVKIKKNGKSVHPDFASDYYDSIGLGIDFTARDLQADCKENRLPWEISKAFDNSALLSKEFIPLSNFIEEGSAFRIEKNGEIAQQADTSMMVFTINELIVYISQYFTLQKGDLIYTGTPKGVSKILPGHKYEGFINNHKMFSLEVK